TDKLPGSRRTVGDELLRVHRNYEPALRSIPPRALHAAAHITGGGLPDNLPRALPAGCRAVIDRRRLRVPHLFRLIAERGRVAEDEMFRVFNMGVGMVLVVAARDARAIAAKVRGRIIGEVVKGMRGVELV
ncbi:MAG: AIR synthase-related protein, partial [Chthoniobacterales bacterium]